MSRLTSLFPSDGSWSLYLLDCNERFGERDVDALRSTYTDTGKGYVGYNQTEPKSQSIGVGYMNPFTPLSSDECIVFRNIQET